MRKMTHFALMMLMLAFTTSTALAQTPMELADEAEEAATGAKDNADSKFDDADLEKTDAEEAWDNLDGLYFNYIALLYPAIGEVGLLKLQADTAITTDGPANLSDGDGDMDDGDDDLADGYTAYDAGNFPLAVTNFNAAQVHYEVALIAYAGALANFEDGKGKSEEGYDLVDSALTGYEDAAEVAYLQAIEDQTESSSEKSQALIEKEQAFTDYQNHLAYYFLFFRPVFGPTPAVTDLLDESLDIHNLINAILLPAGVQHGRGTQDVTAGDNAYNYILAKASYEAASVHYVLAAELYETAAGTGQTSQAKSAEAKALMDEMEEEECE